MKPVVRVSILRCPPECFAELRRMAADAELVLRPGIEAMAGLLAFYFGADEATSSLTNVSLWTSLQAAKQLDTFQPMLDLGKPFIAKGATFERPIMNYETRLTTIALERHLPLFGDRDANDGPRQRIVAEASAPNAGRISE